MLFVFFRKETEVPFLRKIVRLRDEPARAHPPAPPGHPRALSLLLAHLHPQQHGAAAHSPRAQGRAQPEGVPADPAAAAARPQPQSVARHVHVNTFRGGTEPSARCAFLCVEFFLNKGTCHFYTMVVVGVFYD